MAWRYLLPAVACWMVAASFIYFWRVFTYWKRRGIPCIQTNIPLGIVWDVICQRKCFAEAYEAPYKMSSEPVVGIFEINKPVLVIRDLGLIKEILTRSFPSFCDRGLFVDEKADPLSANLFFLKFGRWKALRAKLTPTFSSGKIKAMLPTVVSCGDELCALLRRSAGTSAGVAEVKDAVARFTTDVIAACAFGVQGRSLADPDAEFRRWGVKCFEPSIEVLARNMLAFVLPSVSSFFGIRTTPSGVTEFFQRLVRDTVSARESAGGSRPDFLQLLMQLRNTPLSTAGGEKSSEAGLTDDEIMAQVFLFFLAGFETSSTAITFCLYELSLNMDIQRKLQLEVEMMLELHDGQVTYDAVQSLKYLDMVVSETLRKYPPLAFLNRECTQTYRIPGTSWEVEKGTSVLISLLGIHRDPQYYPEPERFDPERFSDMQKNERLPLTYMPFGEGPRICLGMRFGLMQVKVGLIQLLRSFVFRPCALTPQPMTFDPKSLFLAPSDGMWLHLTPTTAE